MKYPGIVIIIIAVTFFAFLIAPQIAEEKMQQDHRTLQFGTKP